MTRSPAQLLDRARACATARKEGGCAGEASGWRTSHDARLVVPVPVTFPDHPGLQEGAAADGGHGVGIVLGEVEVAREPQPDVGEAIHEAQEDLRVAGVVQPGTPVLHVHSLHHRRWPALDMRWQPV